MKTTSPDLTSTRITSGFWRKRIDTIVKEVIPYQWKALNDQIPGAEPSHAIENFRIAAGKSGGAFYGLIFQDSDVGKWIEAASYGLIDTPDPSLEKIIDGVVKLIALSQEDDGYLDTYFSMTAPDKKWTDFAMGHEMYCGGHLIEGAVAYHKATGKRQFLDTMIRYADHLDRRFGNGPGKTAAYCGHPEIELALFRLYETTGETRYRDLARFFIDERGRRPEVIDNKKVIAWQIAKESPWHGPDYYVSHAPVREQAHADGHAVRAMYLYCAMADQWRLTGDQSLGIALERLWESAVNRRMYITGGLGSQAVCERFTVDRDLPSDTAYAETCAAIGLVLWSWRMTLASPRREYADTLERALYNGALSGISLDGTSYFYVNPLEVVPEVAKARKDLDHVKCGRVRWFGCACCPPNIARLICSVAQFQYSHDDRGLWVHQYASSSAAITMSIGSVGIDQSTNYPWDGNVELRLAEVPAGAGEWSIRLRIPEHAEFTGLSVNGSPVHAGIAPDGYVEIRRVWLAGDIVRLILSMPVRIIRAHPKAREIAGLVALQRGPLVYCAEEADNGADLHLLRVDTDEASVAAPCPEIETDALKIVIKGRHVQSRADGALYSTDNYQESPRDIVLVPYFAWGNRGPGEMRVWLHG